MFGEVTRITVTLKLDEKIIPFLIINNSDLISLIGFGFGIGLGFGFGLC